MRANAECCSATPDGRSQLAIGPTLYAATLIESARTCTATAMILSASARVLASATCDEREGGEVGEWRERSQKRRLAVLVAVGSERRVQACRSGLNPGTSQEFAHFANGVGVVLFRLNNKCVGGSATGAA
jgi:hypothetical protein